MRDAKSSLPFKHLRVAILFERILKDFYSAFSVAGDWKEASLCDCASTQQ
jgi:hypothetical protein